MLALCQLCSSNCSTTDSSRFKIHCTLWSDSWNQHFAVANCACSNGTTQLTLQSRLLFGLRVAVTEFSHQDSLLLLFFLFLSFRYNLSDRDPRQHVVVESFENVSHCQWLLVCLLNVMVTLQITALMVHESSKCACAYTCKHVSCVPNSSGIEGL